ncbi:MAG: hypothetical protein L0K86_14950, partial [Actinomycetia bacterium]|nr:hypothetical protein [Actinomycetes bacterium]
MNGATPVAVPDDDGPGLPRPLTSFVGRDDELRAIRAVLDEHRLVTLAGPGGGGKTRLAIAAAGSAADR